MSDMYDDLDFMKDDDSDKGDITDFIYSLEDFFNTRGFLSRKQINALIKICPVNGKLIETCLAKNEVIPKYLWKKAAKEAGTENDWYFEDHMAWGH